MFSAWKEEKAIATLVDEAQALAERLESAKPHVVDGYAASVRYWAVVFGAQGQNLHDLAGWKPKDAARFASAAQTRIAALRKARDYGPSDGLAVWLHTARAVGEPRIVPPVRAIWQHLLTAGPNAATMAADMVAEAGLTVGADLTGGGWTAPKGFDTDPA